MAVDYYYLCIRIMRVAKTSLLLSVEAVNYILQSQGDITSWVQWGFHGATYITWPIGLCKAGSVRTSKCPFPNYHGGSPMHHPKFFMACSRNIPNIGPTWFPSNLRITSLDPGIPPSLDKPLDVLNVHSECSETLNPARFLKF